MVFSLSAATIEVNNN